MIVIRVVEVDSNIELFSTQNDVIEVDLNPDESEDFNVD